MRRNLRIAAQFAGAAVLLCLTAIFCRDLGSNRATAAMMMLLEVLAIATLGNWVLALFSSSLASVAFSYYFLDIVGTVHLTPLESAVNFAAMALTGLTGSMLSIRAHTRAQEAIHRREEMERLNQLGKVLLACNTVAEAGEETVRKVVELFDLRGAVLRLAGTPRVFQSGLTTGGQASAVPLDTGSGAEVLELYGPQPSEEVRNTLASMIQLLLERARNAEERAQMDVARRGEELRTTVLNAMAHNLKTPLTSIKAAASMLRVAGGTSTVDQSELVAVIDEEADRLNQLIRESLDMAKLEARRANPVTEQCFLPDIVARVASRMSRYFGRREFIVDIPEDFPPIMGDSYLLEQMLIQVVDNAWKYSPPGAPIRVSGKLLEKSVILTVWNRGSEIPEDERDRIFDKFYRGSKDRSRVEGTGLGLAIAKTIAEACKGRIWLESESMGLAFRFELPLATGRRRVRKQHDIAN